MLIIGLIVTFLIKVFVFGLHFSILKNVENYVVKI